jgi:hypothetical protein
MITKEYSQNEVFIYLNGELLYKRWINHGYGKVFCNVWGNRPFSANDVWQHVTEKKDLEN